MPCGCGLTFGAYVALLIGQAGNLKRQRASQVAGFAAAMIGAAAFIGWWVSRPVLSTWVSGFATVKPATALCLAALGAALVHPGKNSRFAFAVGLAVAAVAALDLLDRAGVDLGFNQLNGLLVPRAATPGHGAASFAMINGMPLAIAVAGGSLVVSRFERHHFTATVLGGLAGIMALFAMLNYLTGIHALYSSVDPPALPTAVGLFCIAAAIVLRMGAMPALQKPRPLWQLQVMLGCAIVAPLVLFGVYAGTRVTDAQLREGRNELLSEARILAAGVDREVIGEIERLQALAASPSLREGDFAEFQRQAQASLAWQQRGNIVLIDRNMQQLVNTFVPFGKPLPRAVASEPVERTFATGKPQVTGLFMAPIVNEFMYGVTAPVEIGGETRYVVGRSQNQHALGRLVAANELPPGRLAVIADAAHRIIARSEQEDAFIGKELLPAQRHSAGPVGVFEFTDSEGRPSLEAYARSELTGWEAAVWAPTALIEAPVRALWWTIGFTAVAAFALVVALASWLGRLIARSVGHAVRAATTLGKGDPLPSYDTPVAEVDTLMAELGRAAARRRAAEHDLQASRERLQLAFDATQLGWWQYDLRRRMLSVDPRTKEIFDFTADEVPIKELMERVHPGDAERFWTNREAALDSPNPKAYAHEYRVRRRDGTIRWVEGRGVAYFEGDGAEQRAVRLIGTVQDVTERKEREEKEHLLMREINHRAKNMLSVVDAIAHQTAARNPEGFIERFSERIQALSANQDLLVRNEWNGVEIADLVRAQLAHFADLIGSRIALNGPRLRLKPASAQAIGLALHELATNAGKYGALSTDTGRAYVSWARDGDILTMSWVEREGPPVSKPQRRGFGSIVMETMAERSVDGKVDLEYAPSGVTWRLTCPAANALEVSSV
jgi:PAS domain S-box-containing protein